jgi:hypothetical protein
MLTRSSLYRTAFLLSLPISLTVSAVVAHSNFTATRSVQRTVAKQIKTQIPKRKPPIPKIVAVDRRIARRVNGLRPCVKQRLQRVARKLPKKVTLLVTSATRTYAEQKSLRGTFGVKATPGRSTHEDGRAIDVNVLVDGERVSPRLNKSIIGGAMASEGFRALGAMDPVHYSVPTDEIDTSLVKGPLMDLPTMTEFRELVADEAGTLVAAGDSGTPRPESRTP